jgi:hypothetical protein
VRLAETGDGVLIEVADAGPGMSPRDAARAFDRFHRAGPAADEPAAPDPRHYQEGNGADRATAPYPVAVGPRLDYTGAGSQPTAVARYRATRGGAGRAGEPGGSGHDGYGPAGGGPDDNGRDRADRTSGSGLGLSIVQAIATAHGGRATLESAEGIGTRVRVWLPVRVVP